MEDNRNSKDVKRFENFEVWKKNHELVITVYRVTRDFTAKDESVAKELQNAARFITQSIVEGYNRRNPQDKYGYYSRARDASFIFQDVLLIARDLEAFKPESNDFDTILEITISGRRMLNGLIDTFQNKNTELKNSERE